MHCFGLSIEAQPSLSPRWSCPWRTQTSLLDKHWPIHCFRKKLSYVSVQDEAIPGELKQDCLTNVGWYIVSEKSSAMSQPKMKLSLENSNKTVWQTLADTLSQRKAQLCLSPPEGRPGVSDVSSLSGISGLSFDSTLLSPRLFFCLVLLPFLSYRFLPAGPFFYTFSRKFFKIFRSEIGFFVWLLFSS